jgi:hypothetical protein
MGNLLLIFITYSQVTINLSLDDSYNEVSQAKNLLMLCIAIIISKMVVIHVSEDRVNMMIDYLGTLSCIFKEEKLPEFKILHRGKELAKQEEIKEFEIFSGDVEFIQASNKLCAEEVESIKKNQLKNIEPTELTVTFIRER